MKGEFYKMEFDAWDEGTVELTLEEEAAYLRLCHQMYRRKGPVPNSDRMLCSLWRCHQNKARPLLQKLIAKGKIAVTADGGLTNLRVLGELEARAEVSKSRAESGRTGGTKSGHVRRTQGTRAPHTRETLEDAQSNLLKINNTNEAKRSREEKIRKEEKEDAAPSAASTRAELEREFFRKGKQLCGKNAGGLLATLLKSRQQDIGLAMAVLDAAAMKQDPREYVAASCKTVALTVRDQQQQKSDDAVEQLKAHNRRSLSDRGAPDSVLPEDPGRRPKDLLGGFGGTLVELPELGARTHPERGAWDTSQVQVFACDKRNQGNGGSMG